MNVSSAEHVFAASKVPASSARQASKPLPDHPALPIARCIGREFPSGIAYFGRAAPDAAPEKSICRNRQRTFRKRAVGCHRRGNALRPSAPKRRNIGPWLTSIFGVGIARNNGIKVLPADLRNAKSPMFYSTSAIADLAPRPLRRVFHRSDRAV